MASKIGGIGLSNGSLSFSTGPKLSAFKSTTPASSFAPSAFKATGLTPGSAETISSRDSFHPRDFSPTFEVTPVKIGERRPLELQSKAAIRPLSIPKGSARFENLKISDPSKSDFDNDLSFGRADNDTLRIDGDTNTRFKSQFERKVDLKPKVNLRTDKTPSDEVKAPNRTPKKAQKPERKAADRFKADDQTKDAFERDAEPTKRPSKTRKGSSAQKTDSARKTDSKRDAGHKNAPKRDKSNDKAQAAKSTKTAPQKAAAKDKGNLKTIPLPGNLRLNPNGAKERFERRAQRAGEVVKEGAKKVVDGVKNTSRNVTEAIKHPVEGAKGGFQALQNIFRDGAHSAKELSFAASNGGKLNPFTFNDFPSDNPKNQPKNQAQAGGAFIAETVAGVVANGAKLPGGKGPKFVPSAVGIDGKAIAGDALETAAKTGPKVPAGSVVSATKGSPSGNNSGSEGTESKVGPEPLDSATSAKKFRHANHLKPIKSSAIHDTRHPLLGKTTTRRDENVVNSMEASLFKDFQKPGIRSVSDLTKNKAQLQSSFDTYVESLSEYSKDAQTYGETIVKEYRDGVKTFEQTKDLLRQKGFVHRFDRQLDELTDRAENAYDDDKIADVLDAHVRETTAPPSREQALQEYKSTLRNIDALSRSNRVKPSEIVDGSTNFSYRIKPEHLDDANKALNDHLNQLK
jgi:hypothetical protein